MIPLHCIHRAFPHTQPPQPVHSQPAGGGGDVAMAHRHQGEVCTSSPSILLLGHCHVIVSIQDCVGPGHDVTRSCVHGCDRSSLLPSATRPPKVFVASAAAPAALSDSNSDHSSDNLRWNHENWSFSFPPHCSCAVVIESVSFVRVALAVSCHTAAAIILCSGWDCSLGWLPENLSTSTQTTPPPSRSTWRLSTMMLSQWPGQQHFVTNREYRARTAGNPPPFHRAHAGAVARPRPNADPQPRPPPIKFPRRDWWLERR